MADPTTIICVWVAFMALVVFVLVITANRKLRRLPPVPPVNPTVYEKLPTLPANWRRPPRICPKCGYDLRATPNRCPECGTAFANPSTESEEKKASATEDSKRA